MCPVAAIQAIVDNDCRGYSARALRAILVDDRGRPPGQADCDRRIAEAGQRTAVGAWPDGSFALSPPRTVI